MNKFILFCILKYYQTRTLLLKKYNDTTEDERIWYSLSTGYVSAIFALCSLPFAQLGSTIALVAFILSIITFCSVLLIWLGVLVRFVYKNVKQWICSGIEDVNKLKNKGKMPLDNL